MNHNTLRLCRHSLNFSQCHFCIYQSAIGNGKQTEKLVFIHMVGVWRWISSISLNCKKYTCNTFYVHINLEFYIPSFMHPFMAYLWWRKTGKSSIKWLFVHFSWKCKAKLSFRELWKELAINQARGEFSRADEWTQRLSEHYIVRYTTRRPEGVWCCNRSIWNIYGKQRLSTHRVFHRQNLSFEIQMVKVQPIVLRESRSLL